MADLSITTLSVLSGTVNSNQNLGEAVSVGDVLRLNGASYIKADATTSENAKAAAVAIASGVINAKAVVAQNGARIDVGSGLVKGETYVVSQNSGKIAPRSDLVSGDRFTVVGFAESTSVLLISLTATDIEI